MTVAAPIELAVPTLWQPPRPVGAPHESPYSLRDYQDTDADGIEALWDRGHRNPCIREATGLGKSLIIAELVRRRASRGRVLVAVDVGILAADLVGTIADHT